MTRRSDLIYLYALLDRLEDKLSGKRSFLASGNRSTCPKRGVYFFFEPGENRSDSGDGLRIVRVGTHAVVAGSQSTLWARLRQHRGVVRNNGGNHRGSIFRLLVGTALRTRIDAGPFHSWGHKSDIRQAAQHLGQRINNVRAIEHVLEVAVSNYIGGMPFLWVNVPDPPQRGNRRTYIERNAIALLSNWEKPALDQPSSGWLGYNCDRERVRESGLWNNNHVDEGYDPAFLQMLEECIAATESVPSREPNE